MMPRASIGLSSMSRRPARVENLEDRRLMSAAALGVGAANVNWNGEQHQVVADSWVVDLHNVHGKPAQQVGQANARLAKAGKGLKALRQLGQDGLFQVQSAPGTTADDVRAALGKVTGVASVEPDFVLTTQATTANDTYFASTQWALNNTGQSGGTADADIDAPEAWDLTRGNGSVVVGVIDSGVDYTHPDLAANIWTNPGEVAGDGVDNDGNGYVDDVHGWDFANGDNDAMDDNGHGTHVAGTIAASGNNGAGVAGVNWDAKVVPLKFIGADGSGSLSNALSAINYATNLRLKGVNLRVTNNSWGGGGYSQTLFDAIKRQGDAGILFAAAAGNGGADGVGDNNDALLSYPSSYNLPNVVAVAATDRNDLLASFSNYGATEVDLAAPGVDIASTAPGGGYVYMSGTSMATPHVSGVAALAFAYNPSATVQNVRDALLGGADKVSGLTGKLTTGGRLNAFNTLTPIAPVATPTPTPTPTVAVPTAPASLAAKAASRGQINLTWQDRSSNEAGFSIEISTDGGKSYRQLSTISANAVSASVTGLSRKTTYFFRVRAFNDAGNSAYSNVASARTSG
jgi:subtilisin family serine protease